MALIAPLSPEDYLRTQWDFFWHYWYVWLIILGIAFILRWVLGQLE